MIVGYFYSGQQAGRSQGESRKIAAVPRLGWSTRGWVVIWQKFIYISLGYIIFCCLYPAGIDMVPGDFRAGAKAFAKKEGEFRALAGDA